MDAHFAPSDLAPGPEPTSLPRVRPPVIPLVRRVLLMLATIWTSLSVDPVLSSIERVAHWVAGGFQRSEAIALFRLTSLAVHALSLVLVGVVAISAMRYARARRRMPGAPVPIRVDGEGLHAGDRLVVATAELSTVEVRTDPESGFALVVARHDGLMVSAPMASEEAAHALATALCPSHDPSAVVFEGLADARTRETRAALVATAVICVLAAVHVIAVPYLTTSWIRQLAPAPWSWGKHPETLQYWLLWLQRFSTLPVGALSIFAAGAVVRRLVPGRVRVDARGLRLGGAEGRDLAWRQVADVELGEGSDVALVLTDGERVRLSLMPERPIAQRDVFVARLRRLLAARPRAVSAPELSAPSSATLRARLVDPGA